MSKSKKAAVIICIILTVIFLGTAVASAVPTKKPTDDTPTVDAPTVDAPTLSCVCYNAGDNEVALNLVELPEDVQANGYTGGQVLQLNKSYNNFKIDLDADLNEIDLTGYTHLSVWVGIPAIEYQESETKAFYSFTALSTVFGETKYFVPVGTATDETSFESGKMHNLLIPIQDVLDNLNTSGGVRLFVLMRNQLVNAYVSVYLGQPELVNVPEVVTENDVVEE